MQNTSTRLLFEDAPISLLPTEQFDLPPSTPIVRMPYTPPSQRSPASSNPQSPNLSRRSSYQHNQYGGYQSSPVSSNRPELPRSTSYLTRHRRTTSVKTPTFDLVEEPSPPGTADKESNDKQSLPSSGSLRQSPPPLTDDKQIPVGAVISPPDSAQNSSDDEDSKRSSRDLENLAELQKVIRTIGQHRESSPIRAAEEVGKVNQQLTLIMPSETIDPPTLKRVEEVAQNMVRKISHNRSNTDSSILANMQTSLSPETPLTFSDEEYSDDGDRNGIKPPMLRKKSGELVRPALRPSSARRRPSSMPGTPTYSKAVHFDSHLEHVRHFLQVDRPLAVSAGSSPVEAYESDGEFPFEEPQGRGPPFEWEIVVSNFPAETPHRLSLPVRVERVFLSADNKNLVGSVAVANLAFNKYVVARFTLDYWKTTSEVVAEYNNDIRQPKHIDGYDRFNFNIKLADQANLEAKTMFFCVKYVVNGTEYWDNNNATNFQIDFRKKAKPQNGKKGRNAEGRSSSNSLPRSNKKVSPSIAKSKTMPVTFDDFADGFDAKYSYDLKQPVSDFLGESGTSIRLKGVKSAVNLGSDNLTRRAPQPHGQAFGNRYDFGASLSAAIQAANSVLGDRSGIQMKPSAKHHTRRKFVPTPDEAMSPLSTKSNQRVDKGPSPAPASAFIAPATLPSSSGADSPRPAGTEKPVLASQSYNELLDKYCFFGSVKSSPQHRDGTLSPGQLDGANDEGYVLATPDSADCSPLMMEKKAPPPRIQPNDKQQSSRSTSPAPMTGFVTAIRG
ncbi:hypothetical protein HYFRA_00007038 [Hymenoscyphus fraxineus]|uniref:CBM21 domain-containing protein n=1 Tax=Hymenoscyphus fraxineus TaxID=746836 RepID=A0A9N9PIW2_9HELO|nr:hypothetical protein HYFRA_00007038 [Hymenoscyphus fraxineus]